MGLSITFIIIGKNEGIKIKKCLTSVFATIEKNALEKTEVIYVDSDSDDESIDLALAFSDVKVIKISGEINAAIARNEGAKCATKDILFFIDGDMEVNPDFLPLVVSPQSELIYEFISGDFISVDQSGSQVKYHGLNKDVYMSTTGGVFITYKRIWDQLGGMKPKFRRSQDIDFGLRMSRTGKKLLRKKDIIAYHHTVFYHSKKRLWKDLFNNNQLFQKSVLFRDHIFNQHIYLFILREITLMSLVLSLYLTISRGNVLFLFVFLMMIVVKVIYKRDKLVDPTSMLRSILYYTILDIQVLFGLFLFWPSNKKKYDIQSIRT